MAAALNIAPLDLRVRHLRFHQMLIVVPSVTGVDSALSMVSPKGAILARVASTVFSALHPDLVEVYFEGALYGHTIKSKEKLFALPAI